MPRSGEDRTLGEYLSDDLTRTRILRGAARAFGRSGVAGAPVEEILREAGVSRRTFYQNFENKEDVLLALFDVAMDQLYENTRQAIDGVTDPFERVQRAVSAHHELIRKAGPLVTVLQAESIRPDSKLAPRREAVFKQLTELFIATAPDTVDLEIDPYVVRGCMLINEGLLMHAARNGTIPEQEALRIREVVVPMIIRTLYAETGSIPALPTAPTESIAQPS